MHEIGLMESVLEMACDRAQQNGGSRIHRIGLQVGAVSGVVPEALQFAFAACTAGTPAEEATLEIEWLPAICHCAVCNADFEPTDWVYVCPSCDRPSTDIRQGHELLLLSVEIS